MRLRGSRAIVLVSALLAAAWAAMVLAFGALGQTHPPAGGGLRYPEGCAAYELSEPRCAYITRWAAQELGADQGRPLAFELLGDPLLDPPGCADGNACLTSRTQAFIVRVRVHDGPEVLGDASVFCGIAAEASWLCTETPVIATRTPTSNGYHDVPCADEDGEACATPVPTPRAAALAGAVPLVVADLTIPIDRVGLHEVVVGEARLPNGILRQATLGLGPARPTQLLLSPEGVTLSVESLDGGGPIENLYDHGWRPGVERVRVILEFTVEEFAPGATLDVADLAVR
jgi:hypothetical protein